MQTNRIAFQINQILSLEEDRISAIQTLLLALLAYAVGAGFRLFYLFNALEVPSTLLDGVPMISTEDGYLFASYVKNVVNDPSLAKGYFFYNISGRGLLIFLTWIGYQITPFTIEQVAVFMPMILTPLVVFPLVYLGRLLGSTLFGFFAATITVVGVSFLRRTSFSYFDTDFFSLTVPSLIILAGIYAILNPSLRAVVFLALLAALSDWLDKFQVSGPMYLMVGFFYVLLNFRRASLPEELVVLAAALEPNLSWYYERMLLVGVLGTLIFFLRRYYSAIDRKWLLGGAIVYILYVIWGTPLFASIRAYTSYFGVAGRGVTSGVENPNWNYYQVSGTIAEARTVNIQQLTYETLGYTWMFIFGLTGAFLALLRYPLLAIGGIFLAVGLFSLQGGIRFVVYMIPVLGMGSAFVILLIKRYMSEYIPQKYFGRYFSWLLAIVALAMFLYPGFKFSYASAPRFVAHPQQVEMLRKLEKTSSPEDYIISWWDYGYVMSYYSGLRNIINGGKHNEDNYIVSKALSSSSQILAANMIRESVEAYESENRTLKATEILLGTRSVDFSPTSFVRSMASPDYVLQRDKTREIYLYLPYQMLRIYAVVRYFSDLNLETGRLQRVPILVENFYRLDRENNRIVFSNSMVADLKSGELRQRDRVIGTINTVYNHQIQNNGQPDMQSYAVSGIGNYFIILSSHYRQALVLGPEAFNANFIQMFFFNKYNPRYFELVERTALAAIYKLKI